MMSIRFLSSLPQHNLLVLIQNWLTDGNSMKKKVRKVYDALFAQKCRFLLAAKKSPAKALIITQLADNKKHSTLEYENWEVEMWTTASGLPFFFFFPRQIACYKNHKDLMSSIFFFFFQKVPKNDSVNWINKPYYYLYTVWLSNCAIHCVSFLDFWFRKICTKSFWKLCKWLV